MLLRVCVCGIGQSIKLHFSLTFNEYLLTKTADELQSSKHIRVGQPAKMIPSFNDLLPIASIKIPTNQVKSEMDIKHRVKSESSKQSQNQASKPAKSDKYNY